MKLSKNIKKRLPYIGVFFLIMIAAGAAFMFNAQSGHKAKADLFYSDDGQVYVDFNPVSSTVNLNQPVTFTADLYIPDGLFMDSTFSWYVNGVFVESSPGDVSSRDMWAASDSFTFTFTLSGSNTVSCHVATDYNYYTMHTTKIDCSGAVAVLSADATPIPQFTVQTAILDSFGGQVGTGNSITPDVGSHSYHMGDQVSLTASPGVAFNFDYWQFSDGRPSSSSLTYDLTVTEGLTVTAVFGEINIVNPTSSPTPPGDLSGQGSGNNGGAPTASPAPTNTPHPTASPSAAPSQQGGGSSQNSGGFGGNGGGGSSGQSSVSSTPILSSPAGSSQLLLYAAGGVFVVAFIGAAIFVFARKGHTRK